MMDIIENGVIVQAWTTENSSAVVWGTHDLELAKKVYREYDLDTEPDWEDGTEYWGRPGLDEEETWTDGSMSTKKEEEDWVPFLTFEF